MSLLVMLAGALITIQGILDLGGVQLVPAPDIVKPYLLIVGLVSLVSGLLVIYGGWLISQKKKFTGSRIAVAFAIIGFAGGGGFIIGTILGLAGGVMNFRVVE